MKLRSKDIRPSGLYYDEVYNGFNDEFYHFSFKDKL